MEFKEHAFFSKNIHYLARVQNVILWSNKKRKNFVSKNSVCKEERKKRSFLDAKIEWSHNLRFAAAFLTPSKSYGSLNNRLRENSGRPLNNLF